MKKIISVICAVVLFVSSFSIAVNAVSADECSADIDAAYAFLFDGVAGDVTGDGAIAASDARAVLLASAGVTDEGNVKKADMDADGMVTAIDARMVLRVSAKLDDADSIIVPNQLKLFNAFLNNIKASQQRVRYSSYSENLAIECSNEPLFTELTEEMNEIMKAFPEEGVQEEEFDLLAEMKVGEGEKRWTRGERTVTKNSQFFVTNKDYVSNLTQKDIASIEYKTNQDYSYQHTRLDANGKQDNASNFNKDLVGLDSITVKIDTEELKTIPGDMTTIKHGKIFDVPDAQSLDAGYDSVNEMFAGLEEMLGTFSVGLKYLKFHKSYVTIYFDRETKKLCAAEYVMYYDFAQHFDIDLDSSLALEILGIKLNVKGTADLTNKEYSRYSCCFPDNIPKK